MILILKSFTNSTKLHAPLSLSGSFVEAKTALRLMETGDVVKHTKENIHRTSEGQIPAHIRLKKPSLK